MDLLLGGHGKPGPVARTCHVPVRVQVGKPPRSDGDSVQAEHFGLVSKELGTESNDAASYRVEVLDLVGLELLQ